MEDIMNSKKDNKSEIVKFRITKKEKLIKAAKSENESLSSYIQKKIQQEYPDPFQSLPQIIDTNNFFNEIYHKIEKSGNETLTKEIFLLCHKYISNPGRKE